jgi:putative DNA methylase
MVEAGILKAGAGKARLLRREEMDPSWDPSTDRRLTVWEATQYLIRTLESEGESEASELQKKLGGLAQSVRDLAYRLYSTCERQGWSQDALAYNSLVKSWPRLQDLAAEKMRKGGQQTFEV